MKRILLLAILLQIPSTRSSAQTATPTAIPLCCVLESSWTKELDRPVDVKVHGSRVYVANSYKARVEVFLKGSAFPLSPIEHPSLSSPFGLALDGAGRLYVTDPNWGKVVRFTQEGLFLGEFNGSGGTAPGLFQNPTGIWANGAGTTLIIAEGAPGPGLSGRVRIFVKSGNDYYPLELVVLPALPNPYNPVGVLGREDGSLFVVDAWNDSVIEYSGGNFTSGTVRNLWVDPSEPRFITQDWSGNFYVTDQGMETFTIFRPDWSVERVCTLPVFGQVQGISVDLDGRAYLGVPYANQVLVEAPCSNFIQATPTPGTYHGADAPGPGQALLYPSPVRGSTATVGFRMASQGNAKVRVWNANGELVLQEQGERPSGVQTLPLDLLGLANGIYFFNVKLEYPSGTREDLPPGKFLLAR